MIFFTSVAHLHSGWFFVSHASSLACSTESRLHKNKTRGAKAPLVLFIQSRSDSLALLIIERRRHYDIDPSFCVPNAVDRYDACIVDPDSSSVEFVFETEI